MCWCAQLEICIFQTINWSRRLERLILALIIIPWSGETVCGTENLCPTNQNFTNGISPANSQNISSHGPYDYLVSWHCSHLIVRSVCARLASFSIMKLQQGGASPFSWHAYLVIHTHTHYSYSHMKTAYVSFNAYLVIHAHTHYSYSHIKSAYASLNMVAPYNVQHSS